MNYLEELALLVETNPNKMIFFDKRKKEFSVYSTKEFEELDDDLFEDIVSENSKYIEFIEYDKDFYQYNAERLIDKYPEKYRGKDLGKNFSLVKFKKATKELDLYDEWVECIKNDINYDVYEWLNDNDIKDDECSKSEYKEISRLLNVLRKSNYNRLMDSRVVFDIKGTNDHLTFNLLSSEQFDGISFYFGNGSMDAYKTMSTMFGTFMSDQETLFSLVESINFYFEKEELETEFYNPYGDLSITSLSIMPGHLDKNFVTKTLAPYIIQALRDALDELDLFVATKKANKLDKNCYVVKHYEGIDQTIEKVKDDDLFPEALFYDIHKDESYDIEPEVFLKEKWSMTFRKLPSYSDRLGDGRVLYAQYALIIVNEETGKIVNIKLVEPEGRPIQSALRDLRYLFDHQSIPKTILVNTALDEIILTKAFFPLIDKKKIKLQFEAGPLHIDKAFLGLKEEIPTWEREDFDA